MDQPVATIFSFSANVLFDPMVADGYMKHYVPLPDPVSTALRQAGITHVEGTLNDKAFRRALHEHDGGTLCLKFGKIWLDQMGLQIGSAVAVMLKPDDDPDRVDVPDELMAALQDDPQVLHAWEFLSPSRRKTLIYDIERAKRPETRETRIRKLIAELRTRIW
jgi:hypothetical protein